MRVYAHFFWWSNLVIVSTFFLWWWKTWVGFFVCVISGRVSPCFFMTPDVMMSSCSHRRKQIWREETHTPKRGFQLRGSKRRIWSRESFKTEPSPCSPFFFDTSSISLKYSSCCCSVLFSVKQKMVYNTSSWMHWAKWQYAIRKSNSTTAPWQHWKTWFDCGLNMARLVLVWCVRACVFDECLLRGRGAVRLCSCNSGEEVLLCQWFFVSFVMWSVNCVFCVILSHFI